MPPISSALAPGADAISEDAYSLQLTHSGQTTRRGVASGSVPEKRTSNDKVSKDAAATSGRRILGGCVATSGTSVTLCSPVNCFLETST